MKVKIKKNPFKTMIAKGISALLSVLVLLCL